MTDHDPLGSDWKARAERGTAILRERAIEEAAGKLVPVEAIERVLSDLAGSCNGMLQGIADRARAIGCDDAVIGMLTEIVTDVQYSISTALDSAAEAAASDVGKIEDAIEEATPVVDEVRGPKERRSARTHKGKPHSGNTKPKKVRI